MEALPPSEAKQQSIPTLSTPSPRHFFPISTPPDQRTFTTSTTPTMNGTPPSAQSLHLRNGNGPAISARNNRMSGEFQSHRQSFSGGPNTNGHGMSPLPVPTGPQSQIGGQVRGAGFEGQRS